MNLIQLLKTKVNIVYAKYLNKDTIEELPIYYIAGSQTLPPPLDAKEEDEALKKLANGDEEVKKMFEEYPWPGNVRELRNTIEGAFNVAQGKYIHARDLTGYIVQQCGQHEKDSLPCSTGADEGPSGLNDQIHSVEKGIIEDALKKTSTYAEAARLIGISRQAFMYKMKKYKIDV